MRVRRRFRPVPAGPGPLEPVHAGLRRPTPWPLRYARRALAVAAYGAALFAIWHFGVQPLLPGQEATAPAQVQPLPRPESAPARVPAWAWDMHAWHLTPGPERGARPEAAPKRLPAWYWEWRAWRLSLAPPE